MLELMGIETGTDLQALIEAANWLDGVLGGTGLGFVRRTGRVPMVAQQATHAGARIAASWQTR